MNTQLGGCVGSCHLCYFVSPVPRPGRPVTQLKHVKALHASLSTGAAVWRGRAGKHTHALSRIHPPASGKIANSHIIQMIRSGLRPPVSHLRHAMCSSSCAPRILFLRHSRGIVTKTSIQPRRSLMRMSHPLNERRATCRCRPCARAAPRAAPPPPPGRPRRRRSCPRCGSSTAGVRSRSSCACCP